MLTNSKNLKLDGLPLLEGLRTGEQVMLKVEGDDDEGGGDDDGTIFSLRGNMSSWCVLHN